MPDRLTCCVPFCKKTGGDAAIFSEWICGDHWKGIPKQRRQAYGRITKRWRRYSRPEDGAQALRLWARIKAAAIERAAGLT